MLGMNKINEKIKTIRRLDEILSKNLKILGKLFNDNNDIIIV